VIVMLDRLATRALFWTTLALLAGAGGLLSVGSTETFARVLDAFAATRLPLIDYLPRLGDAAPLLSLLSFGIAVAGWRGLHREVTRRALGAGETTSHVQQLHEAMHANVDGVFLLRAIRATSGDITDFEIADVNPSGALLVRAGRDQLIGRRLRRDFAESFGVELWERYVTSITSRQSVAEEIRVNRRQFTGGWLYHQAVPTGDGLAVTIRDVSARKREEVRLRRASLTDELTQLYNRRGFLTMADQQLRLARRQGKDAVLLYVDMDEFKDLNDRYGHAEGDRALSAVGRLLRRAVRDCDVVARMGGDEFTIMALDADRVAARSIQRRIEERVALLNASGELAAPLSLTIGHTRVRPSEAASLPELLARADALLYARKRRRKLAAKTTSRAISRGRPRTTLNRSPVAAPALVVPPDVAAIARATAVAAAASAAAAGIGTLGAVGATRFGPRRMA
jgi:diguanylate cyclase (GGDEF)-like protein